MGNRWIALSVLFTARTSMGFQFQSVASVSSVLIQDLPMDYTQFGLLIGLYQLPGLFLAIPGGLLGRRFGDRRMVAAGLALMGLGGLVVGASPGYHPALAGRLMSGVGAVLLNVLLAKMIADWFSGREMVTAMAVLVSSWPLGLSLGLVSQGALAEALSWRTVMHLTAGVSLVSLALVMAVYRDPPRAGEDPGAAPPADGLSRQEAGLVILAGLIWMLFNLGFITLPSFAPAFLVWAGYTLADAGAMVSALTWISIVAVQLGGVGAERLKRPNLTMVACFLACGLGICVLPFVSQPAWLLILLGLLFGPPAGVIMALPAEVLRPRNRAAGMGVYWTTSYAGSAGLTPLAGLARDLTGHAAAPLWFGGVVLFAAIGALGLFRGLQRRSATGSAG